MWKYYLLISAAYFRAREHNLYQIVATPVGAPQPPTARSSYAPRRRRGVRLLLFQVAALSRFARSG